MYGTFYHQCEFLYAECFQTFHCIYIIIIIKNECHSNIIVDRLQGCRLLFIFEVCYGLFYLYFSRAAISGISVLAVLLDLFCCTCYFVVFLSQ